MNDHDRINTIENRINVLSDEMNKVKININTINNNISEIKDNLNNIKSYGEKINNMIDIINSKKEEEHANKYADENGSLNNLKNPFIQAERDNIKKYHKKNYSFNNNHEIIILNQIIALTKKRTFLPKIIMLNQIKKRGKYKKRDPLYYYYNINGDIYKYTCDNKNSKYDLRFYCTDSKCPAKAILNIETNEFVILNEKIDKILNMKNIHM